MNRPPDHSGSPPSFPIRVQVANQGATGQPALFHQSFRVGRASDADLHIANDYISRYHAQVLFENGAWSIRDLGSSNGLFVNGERVQSAPLHRALDVRLGIEGPWLHLIPEPPPPPPPVVRPPIAAPQTKDVNRYFEKTTGAEPVGEHTMLIRQAFAQIQTKQKRKLRVVRRSLCAVSASRGQRAESHGC